MNRSLTLLLTAALAVPRVFAGELAKPPLPSEMLAGFKLDAGLKIELVACEPQVQSPVAMAFDENGRLFVVEMLDYPNPEKGQPPAGRIRILSGADGEGVYRTASVFADRLPMANGLAVWRGGLIVTCAPHIIFLKDTDGDGVADQREILFEGFAAENPQLRSSHPTLGIDNWFYVTNGARNGKIRRVPDGPKVDINGFDFRFNMLDQRYEPVSGFGQFGLTMDDWGRRFVCTNRNHLIEIVMENAYFARNPYLAAPPPQRDDQRAGGSARVYAVSRNKTLAASHAGSFTAACGIHAYCGGALPRDYEGSVFTCEPTGNLIRREVLSSNGASFSHKPAQDGVEFLASPSPWFRPVNMTTGPDGALYVIDICRAEVEHPDWVPASLKHRYDFNGRRDYGRIWKVTAKAGRQVKSDLNFSDLSALLEKLASDSAWERVTAQRLLLERWNPLWTGPLTKFAGNNNNPRAQVRALWLLQSQNALPASTVVSALSSPHPRVRENAAQLAERFVAASADVQKHLIALANDPDSRVRFQAALSLGAWNDERILEPLAAIAAQDGADRWTRLAIASAVPERSGNLLVLCMTRTDCGDLFAELAAVTGARKDNNEIGALILALEKQPAGNVAAVLDGLAIGLKRRGSSLQKFVVAIGKETLNAALERLLTTAVATAADERQTLSVRERAIALAPQLPESRALAVLAPALSPGAPERVRAAAILAAGALNSRTAAEALLAQWKGSVPAVRQLLLQALTGKPALAAALLDGVESGTIAASELGAAAQRQLSSHGDKATAERAQKVFKVGSSQDRAAVIERYRPALAKGGDPARGRAVFAKNCVACHRIEGNGNPVGPDISDTLLREPDALLTDILDPNRAIDTNYVSYIVKTKAGIVTTGLIAAKTASSLTLRRENGQDETLLLDEIATLQSTGKSLMPEGVETVITPQEVADLIAYLKNWRDLTGK